MKDKERRIVIIGGGSEGRAAIEAAIAMHAKSMSLSISVCIVDEMMRVPEPVKLELTNPYKDLRDSTADWEKIVLSEKKQRKAWVSDRYSGPKKRKR